MTAVMPMIAAADEGFEALFAARADRNAVHIGGEPLVTQILEDVRRRGDEALMYWTTKLDKVTLRPDWLAVVPDPGCLERVEPELLAALQLAAGRIRAYHERFVPASWVEETEPGVRLGSRVSALDRVGIYVPGGKASYPSSVLMCAVPAKVAGVREVVMVTPPRGRHIPLVLEAAAVIAGVDRIFMVGGAQAIAALAFGTERIPRVDKIVGPGNRYVAEAKRQVYGLVDIDSVAGPSEVCVIADGSAPAAWVAADLLAQAEHDEAAAVLLLVTDRAYGEAVLAAIPGLLADNPRKGIAEVSLAQHGLCVVCADLDEAAALADRYAPEHLELVVREPDALLAKIRHAGAAFLGTHTPEAVGDYLAGPNHVLPTQGTARFFSPLGIEDFVKRTSVIEFGPVAIDRYGDAVARLADEEGLYAHAQSVRIRKG